jgi:hypothetical protein
MAVKKSRRVEELKSVSENEPVVATKQGTRWMTAAWMLLLVAGLAHMMPTQMAPILNYAVYGLSVQTVIGTLSVIAALYYLLEE